MGIYPENMGEVVHGKVDKCKIYNDVRIWDTICHVTFIEGDGWNSRHLVKQASNVPCVQRFFRPPSPPSKFSEPRKGFYRQK